MRSIALLCILLCEIAIAVLFSMDITASTLNMISTLVVVVIVSFTFSSMLQGIKRLKRGKVYLISGIIGVVFGIVYFVWAGDNLERMVVWLREYGIYFLLLMILLCSLVLFFSKSNSKRAEKAKPLQNENPKQGETQLNG